MRQTNLKSDRIAELIELIAAKTGESKVKVVTTALEQRLKEVERETDAGRTLAWLEGRVWPQLPKERRGRSPDREEQEDLLGL